MFTLNDLLNVMYFNCKFMIYSDKDENHIIFGGFKEDLYKELLLEYGNYEVKEIRTIFKDLWIKIGE